jgi:HK97 family phage portal protein
LDLKKLSAREIAAAFGIKPHQINDLEKSSYAAVDALNQQFYIDTLLPIVTGYEQEYDYKLFSTDDIQSDHRVKFNIDVVLRATLKDRMSAYSQAIQNGVYTPADARAKEDLPFVEGSDVLLVNGTMIPITVAAKKKGGE